MISTNKRPSTHPESSVPIRPHRATCAHMRHITSALTPHRANSSNSTKRLGGTHHTTFSAPSTREPSSWMLRHMRDNFRYILKHSEGKHSPETFFESGIDTQRRYMSRTRTRGTYVRLRLLCGQVEHGDFSRTDIGTRGRLIEIQCSVCRGERAACEWV